MAMKAKTTKTAGKKAGAKKPAKAMKASSSSTKKSPAKKAGAKNLGEPSPHISQVSRCGGVGEGRRLVSNLAGTGSGRRGRLGRIDDGFLGCGIG